ncbi:acyl-CoA thioesterase [Inquilinus sp. CA228]|uniref:acyl-CoA thioesterase n=1 Tax=Inquilinus sp. CA228 TaxID=3455609 RepID=UPI003F8D7723
MMWPYTTPEADYLTAAPAPDEITPDETVPRGELAARALAMPAHANPSGDIFGGWIMSLMDEAGAMTAMKHAQGRVVTIAATDMAFIHPVKVGDAVCCYAEVARIGRTSITLHIEVWVLRSGLGERMRVTSAEFTFVALDEAGTPRAIRRADARAA